MIEEGRDIRKERVELEIEEGREIRKERDELDIEKGRDTYKGERIAEEGEEGWERVYGGIL